MATREVLALNTTTPQIEVPQSGDTYTLPRATGVTGDLTVTSGNTVIATAGKGIDFSANTHATGMTSELLTWYEEGAFTPGLMFGSGTTGITYAASTTARYTRIGRQVTVTGVVVLTNKGSSSGQAQVTGLPFAVASGADSLATLRLEKVSFANVYSGVLFGTGSKIFLYETTLAGVSTDITDADFANDSSVYFAATYFA